ncbi:uncharacterized protein [Spinacia oleracea]|uniref:Uncharacterized protein n=1 Tax=Spinacia oleracea TaxID=3562 RepID=A0ABM3QIF0_SPIOL|nr:uncharacterized protein LOC130459669 [Spinacia oleracea]
MVCARTVMKKAQGQLHACRVFFSISGRMDMVLVLLESLKITMPHFESFGGCSPRRPEHILSGRWHLLGDNGKIMVELHCQDDNLEVTLRFNPLYPSVVAFSVSKFLYIS